MELTPDEKVMTLAVLCDEYFNSSQEIKVKIFTIMEKLMGSETDEDGFIVPDLQGNEDSVSFDYLKSFDKDVNDRHKDKGEGPV